MSISLWDWTKSNGEATEQQVKDAYAAITGNESTNKFNHLVWNDMVTFIDTNIVQKQGGWVSQDDILPVIATKMSSDYVLTAQRFNSLYTQLKWNYWTWRTQPAKIGYIGERKFQGNTYYKAQPDKVYGWYFLELMDIANKIIISSEYSLSAEVLTGLTDITTLELTEPEKQIYLSVQNIISQQAIPNLDLISYAYLDSENVENLQTESNLTYFEYLELETTQSITSSAFAEIDVKELALHTDIIDSININKAESISQERHLLDSEQVAPLNISASMLEQQAAYSENTTVLNLDIEPNIYIRDNVPIEVTDTTVLDADTTGFQTYARELVHNQTDQRHEIAAGIVATEVGQLVTNIVNDTKFAVDLQRTETVKLEDTVEQETTLTGELAATAVKPIDAILTHESTFEVSAETQAITPVKATLNHASNVILGNFDTLAFTTVTSQIKHKSTTIATGSSVQKQEVTSLNNNHISSMNAAASAVQKQEVSTAVKHSKKTQAILSAAIPTSTSMAKVSEHKITANVDNVALIPNTGTIQHEAGFKKADLIQGLPLNVYSNDKFKPTIKSNIQQGIKKDLTDTAEHSAFVTTTLVNNIPTKLYVKPQLQNNFSLDLSGVPAKPVHIDNQSRMWTNSKVESGTPIYFEANTANVIEITAILDTKDRKYTELEAKTTTITLNGTANANFYDILPLNATTSLDLEALANKTSSNISTISSQTTSIETTSAELTIEDQRELPLNINNVSNLTQDANGSTKLPIDLIATPTTQLQVIAILSMDKLELSADEQLELTNTVVNTLSENHLLTINNINEVATTAFMELEMGHLLELEAIYNALITNESTLNAKQPCTTSTNTIDNMTNEALMELKEPSKEKIYYGVWPHEDVPTSVESFTSEEITDKAALKANGFDHYYEYEETRDANRAVFAFPKSLGELVNVYWIDLPTFNILKDSDYFTVTECGDNYLYCGEDDYDLNNTLCFRWY